MPERGLGQICNNTQRVSLYSATQGTQIDKDTWLSVGFYRIEAGQTFIVQTFVGTSFRRKNLRAGSVISRETLS